MVCEDCGNIIGDQVIPGLIHAIPAEQMQVHPAASKLIDFPIFVAGTEIVVDGDKIVEVTSPRGRKIIQLHSESGDGREERSQQQQQVIYSSLEVEGERERAQYNDPYSVLDTAEDNDPYNRLEVDVIMLEDSQNVFQQGNLNLELGPPLNVAPGITFLTKDPRNEALKENLPGPVEVSRMMTDQSLHENDPKVAQTKFSDSPAVIEASQIKLTNQNFWQVDEIITEAAEPPQKVAEVMDIDNQDAPNSDSVHKEDNVKAVDPPIVTEVSETVETPIVSEASKVKAMEPPVIAEVSQANAKAVDPPVVAVVSQAIIKAVVPPLVSELSQTNVKAVVPPIGIVTEASQASNVKAVDPCQAHEDSQVSQVIEPAELQGSRLEMEAETSAGPIIKVKPTQELMMVAHCCFRCGSEDSTGPWHKHKRREQSFLCHLCFSYYR